MSSTWPSASSSVRPLGKIVSALVEHVVMPPLGMILSGVSFTDLAVEIGVGTNGKPVLLK